jgi:ribonuclease HI
MESLFYVAFTDGASHHTQNLASSTWVIYSLEVLLVSSGGVCLGPSTNNMDEYNAVIKLLRDAISHGIHSIEVCLDSQLVVCQLNGRYCVRDPTLLCRFLQVRLLERQFDFITYFHILRSSNHVSDAYTNYVLNWHFSH